MIKTEKQAKKVQRRRFMSGRRGVAKAVRRFYLKHCDDIREYLRKTSLLPSDWTGCRIKGTGKRQL